MVGALLSDLGPDTVELVKRDADPATVDQWGIPARTEHTITKQRCSAIEEGAAEEIGNVTIAVVNLNAALPVDADTEGLAPGDAVRFHGRTFEMQGPGIRHDTLDGQPSHVRVNAQYAADASLGEQVIVIPAGDRDDHGNIGPDGDPVPLIARAVIRSGDMLRFGVGGPQMIPQGGGTMISRDYTVVLDLDAPIRDGDWIIVRGDECRAIIGRQESQWQARRQLLVHAQYRAGGMAG